MLQFREGEVVVPLAILLSTSLPAASLQRSFMPFVEFVALGSVAMVPPVAAPEPVAFTPVPPLTRVPEVLPLTPAPALLPPDPLVRAEAGAAFISTDVPSVAPVP
ncbi:hypothetical protein [Mesorhizobium sp. B2-4-15]|uniref:hypothetical protein n=1 Tax=Mesorhizobium sp. B2-4-15 TaxID=2589934 RepID=UPI0015EF7160|nr:hypothetical protein [Mesorhizobium sp. B2-4-15]